MHDLVYIASMLALCGATAAFISLCDRLMPKEHPSPKPTSPTHARSNP